MQKHLIRRTFGIIAGQADMIGQLFYARLFALDGNLRGLFKHDMDEQVQKLMRMIAMCVSYLDDDEVFIPAVEELGARHVDYGVRDEYYATVREAFIWALSEGLGTACTPEVKTAWTALYDLIAEVALRGAHAAKGDAPPTARSSTSPAEGRSE
jgi:hemoglobin-like flavoprotein